MRTHGCIVCVADFVFPLEDPEWRGIAWFELEDIGLLVESYMQRKFHRADQVSFCCMALQDTDDWLALEEQVEELEHNWKSVDPQLRNEVFAALTVEEIEKEAGDVDLQYFAHARKKGAALSEVRPDDLRLMVSRMLEAERRDEPAEEKPGSGNDPPRSSTVPPQDVSAFRPASWFSKGMAARLRMAAAKGRKTKRVSTRLFDGVVMYSVSDARRWWPEDVPKEP